MEKQRFLSQLRALYCKLLFEAFVKRLSFCAATAMGIALLLTIAAKWTYFDISFFYFCLFLGAILCAAGMVVVCDRITYQKAAEAGDALGLEQRLITAYELFEKKQREAIEELAVADAMAHLKKENLVQKYRLHLPKRCFLLFLLLFTATVVCGFTKGPQDKMTEEMKKTIYQVEEIKKEMDKDEKIDKKELQAVDAAIQELKKGIAKSTTEAEAFKEMDKAQQTLKKLEKKSVNDTLQAFGEKLASFSQELNQAAQAGDGEGMKQEMKKLLEKVSAMSAEERKNLLEAMQKAAKEGTEGAFSQALSELAEEMAQGNFKEATAQELWKQLDALAQENETLRQGMQQIQEALAKAGTEKMEPTEEKQGQNNGQQGQNQQGQNNNQQGQNNNQQGQNQQGQGGSQPGAGTGIAGGNGRGFGSGESEQIYTREAQGQAGFDTQISGVQNTGGDSTASEGRTQGQAGESVPYDAVMQEYKSQALQDIENGAVPYGMKQLVEEYFSTLEK